jgi:hypothetical protein
MAIGTLQGQQRIARRIDRAFEGRGVEVFRQLRRARDEPRGGSRSRLQADVAGYHRRALP